jgi:hypothetical protein
MSDNRNELSKLLFSLPVSNRAADTAPEIGKLCADAADAILAAGYVKPRTVDTFEELQALPIGSVIRTAGHTCDHGAKFPPRIAEKTSMDHAGEVHYWTCLDDALGDAASDELDDLPATVLYMPEAGQ